MKAIIRDRFVNGTKMLAFNVYNAKGPISFNIKLDIPMSKYQPNCSLLTGYWCYVLGLKRSQNLKISGL